MKLKEAYSWKERYDQPRQHIQKQRHYFVNKGPSSQGYGFSSSHVWMWELDYKESWELKNWCFWTVVLEKTLEGPLDCKGNQPVHPKGNQSWIFIGKTDVEDETPILWPPDASMSWLLYTVLRWTLGYTCLFPFWFPQCVCPAVGLLDHKAGLQIIRKIPFSFLMKNLFW